MLFHCCCAFVLVEPINASEYCVITVAEIKLYLQKKREFMSLLKLIFVCWELPVNIQAIQTIRSQKFGCTYCESAQLKLSKTFIDINLI